MTRIVLCFCVFMSRKIFVKSSSNQRSSPEQRRVHDAGTSSMCTECWDVQFATICCLLMPSSAVIQLLGYSAWEKKDSLYIRSDKYFITQAEFFLQENATLADISSAGEAALVCMYTCAVGDTLYKLRLLRFRQYTFCAAGKPSSDIISCQVP